MISIKKYCYRGCDNIATYLTLGRKKWVCHKIPGKCSVIAIKISKTKTDSTIIPWNKDKTDVYSDATLKRMSASSKGYPAWNKGLTSETDIRIQKYATTQTGVPKNHSLKGLERIRANGSKSFSGKNNPWYGKSRSKELSPRYNGETKNSEYRRYRSSVDRLTKITYEENRSTINPNEYLRTRAGISNGYQLDHIISVKEGFENSIPAEEIAKKDNLQMLPWEDNITKGK